MRKHGPGIGVALVMISALTFVSAAHPDQRHAELANFHQVNEQLYRGAQPKGDGVRQLAAMGIKTIVNLRGENDRTQEEASLARQLGLRYYNVKMRDMSRPTDEQVNQVLAIINAPENRPVFVHCRRGADRTGVVIACYRIAHDGWSLKQASQEAKHYGLSWTQFGMKDYIEDFYSRHKQATGGNDDR